MLPRIEVEWDDATVSTDDIHQDDAHKVKPERTISRGWLVAETDDGIVMGGDAYPARPNESRVVSFIPWELVINYWEDIV